jgi:hypothetical protein
LERVSAYRLASNYSFEVNTEGALTEDANLQRSVGAGELIGGPFHKLGEVEEESRFDLIFRGGLRLGCNCAKQGDTARDSERGSAESGYKTL